MNERHRLGTQDTQQKRAPLQDLLNEPTSARSLGCMRFLITDVIFQDYSWTKNTKKREKTSMVDIKNPK